jgi:hypothetical protein
VWRERALAGWSALERDAIRTSPRRTRVLDGPGGRRADLWPLVHVLWAAAELRGLGEDVDVDQLFSSVEGFRSGDAYAASPRGRRYFDDNAWLGLAMLRVGEVTSEPVWRGRAAGLARWVEHGEDPAGGVRWAEGHASRNTCSTAAAAWLVLAAGTPDANERAGRWLTWLGDTLRRPDGLYADRIERGRVEPDLWTYNQGAVLAASARLGRPFEALRAAILERWPADRLWAEPPAFAAITYRALLDHNSVETDVDPVWDPFLERLATGARDPDTGWFTAGGVGSYDGRPTIDQAAIVQMFALRAARSG